MDTSVIINDLLIFMVVYMLEMVLHLMT